MQIVMNNNLKFFEREDNSVIQNPMKEKQKEVCIKYGYHIPTKLFLHSQDCHI